MSCIKKKLQDDMEELVLTETIGRRNFYKGRATFKMLRRESGFKDKEDIEASI